MTNPVIIAQKYIDTVRNSGVSIAGAYLFGSYAKGNPHKDSDIDICIVSDNFSDDYIKEVVSLKVLATKVDSRIEPIPFSPSDLENKYSSLAFEIKKYGIPLTI